MRLLIFIVCLLFSHLGHAQLIDPFGNIKTHEIKLTKLKNGSFTGAVEWTTAPKDSLQRFVINGLDVNAPVMVRIVSKAPTHNIDLSFYKTSWDKMESKVSTNGDKFATKTFRTMNIAGVGVSADVAGIPYLLIVRVGLKFPVTKSLVRITDDKEEYASHLSKMGIAGDSFTEQNNSSGAMIGNSNNTLLYILIGLLTIIVILLVVFLVKKQGSKNSTLLFFALASTQLCVAQTEGPRMVPVPGQSGTPVFYEEAPRMVPISGQGDAPVFYEYETQNVANQVPIDYNSPGVMPAHDRVANVDVPVPRGDGTFRTNTIVRLNPNPGSIELSPAETEDIQRRMDKEQEEFESRFIDKMPGKETEGGQRVPNNFNKAELVRLKNEVNELRRQVALLSQEDAEYDANASGNAGSNSNGAAGSGGEIVIYCDDIPACTRCLNQGLEAIYARDAKFQYLQNFYSREIKDINERIAFGNAWSNVHGVSAIVWQKVLHKQIMPAVQNLRKAYSNKFDEYIESMREELQSISACNATHNPGGFGNRAIENQASALIAFYNSTKILD